jgi:hypothetical protein
VENKPTKIIWHHSAVNSTGNQLKGINNYHRQKGFPKSKLGYYVGYHYLIEYSGKVIQTREENEPGFHTRGQNQNSIGICMSGNFSLFMPSREQEQNIGRLITQIMERWNIPAEKIQPHRQHGATECPGKLLSDDWIMPTQIQNRADAIIKLLQKILKELKKV